MRRILTDEGSADPGLVNVGRIELLKRERKGCFENATKLVR